MPTWRPLIGWDLSALAFHWLTGDASVAKIMQWAIESKMQFSFHLSLHLPSNWILLDINKTNKMSCIIQISRGSDRQTRADPNLETFLFPVLYFYGFMIISRAKRASAENPLFSGNNNVNYLMSTAKRARDDRGWWACRGRELRFVISKVETQ